MPGKGTDRPEGLAEQSVNSSIVHPGLGGRGNAEQDDRSAGNRSLTGNDQREGSEKTGADATQAKKSTRP
ncbi:hypothetical protein [Microvirga soli]|uniref:hypothetical protein n=1 Tax=Microvirga soli TaxID=1854496 RepID=UPI00191E72D0|nr:hypothetical protein [Microvirga soli]